jgi:hypothetical protein
MQQGDDRSQTASSNRLQDQPAQNDGNQQQKRQRDECDSPAQIKMPIVSKRRTETTSSLCPSTRLIKSHLFAIWMAWLIMNPDPSYPRRAVDSMVAASLLRSQSSMGVNLIARRSLFGGGGGSGQRSQDGMNAVEAIALIHAMNSGNHGGGGGGGVVVGAGGGHRAGPMDALLNQYSPVARSPRPRQAIAPRQQANPLQRQAPMPPNPVAAALAAAAAVLAALAAVGVAPLVAALLAALAALLVLLAALIVPIPAPLIKKLVIKKTIIPFVIPIPIPIKKEKKEVVYVPKPVHHVKHHYEHEYDHGEVYKVKSKKKKKYARQSVDEIEPLEPLNELDSNSNNDSNDRNDANNGNDARDPNEIVKIQSLLSEQDRIQSMIDQMVEGGNPSPSQNLTQPL